MLRGNMMAPLPQASKAVSNPAHVATGCGNSRTRPRTFRLNAQENSMP
jgi:hypothetical protein